MNISVEDFLKENPIKPKSKSKLTTYKDDIRRLREAGATYAKITEYLERNGVKVSWLTVRQFVIKHLSDDQKPLETKKSVSKVKPPTTPQKQLENASEEEDRPISQLDNYVRPSWAKVDIKDII